MSVLLPRNLDWGVANWVSLGFFHDCVPYLDQAPHLASEIRFCVDADVDTLDLHNAGPAELAELEALVRRVLEATRASGGVGFHDPTMHPIYVAKLEELLAVMERL